MNKTHRWQSFFTEMAAAVLFFSLALAVIVRLFAQGIILSRESSDINGAVFAAQTAAETADLYLEETEITIYYDENWQETASDGAFAVNMTVTPTQKAEGILCSYDIEVIDTEKDSLLFNMTSDKYFKGGD